MSKSQVCHILLFLLCCLAITTRAFPSSSTAPPPPKSTTEEAEDPSDFQTGPPPKGPALYFLTTGANGRIKRMSPSGGPSATVLKGLKEGPDGIAVDKQAGYIYFSNMKPGSIMRVNLDGTGLKTVISKVFQVGKQLILVVEDGVKKLYWCDREGEKVFRSNVDGSGVEVIVDTSTDKCTASECKWPVGVAVDEKNGWVYWSQKGLAGSGSIHRVPTKMRAGETPDSRSDIQTVFKRLPEPIDLHWVDGFGLYWSDRGNGTFGNTVNRMKMSPESMQGVARFPALGKPLVTGLQEGIGIAVDTVGKKVFYTDLGGHVYSANLDGTGNSAIASKQGYCVGIDFVP